MKEISQNQEISPQVEQEAEFLRYFPEATIQRVEASEIPADIMEKFERQSIKFNTQKYRPGNFKSFSKIEHSDESITYIAEQTKTYSTNTEDCIYLEDVMDGRSAGYGKLQYNISDQSDYFRNKPSVGGTRTEGFFQHRGLGTRRLMMMNAIARARFGAPLYSDTVLTDSAKGVWEQLVQKGKAERRKEGEYDRYVMVGEPVAKTDQ